MKRLHGLWLGYGLWLAFFVLGNVHASKSYLDRKHSHRNLGIKTVDHQSYKGVSEKGKVLLSVAWKDGAGENLLLLTRWENKQDVYLYAGHYRLRAGKASLIRRVTDFEKGCEFDLSAEFLPGALTITDLDGNGFSEITMLYKKTCTSDVSPLEMKLIMLEQNRKYALRGLTMMPHVAGLPKAERDAEIKLMGWGAYKIDDSFKKAPAVFLDFSKKRWETFKVQEF